jgi:hypothetical protein
MLNCLAPRAAKTKAAARLNDDSHHSDEDIAEADDVDIADSPTLCVHVHDSLGDATLL